MTKPPPKPKFRYYNSDVNYHEKILRAKKLDFVRSQTGYSVKFERDAETLWITPSQSGFKLYGAFSKLKAYLLRSGPEIDFIPNSQIRYFDLNKNLREVQIKRAYCVDIRSAYLTALFNIGVINQEIYDYINKLPKLDRLKCLGMLATCKIQFTFEAGELKAYNLKRDERLAKYFFLACYEIGEIMQEIKKALGEKFLFYWVDGVFVTDKKAATLAQKILHSRQYQYKLEKIRELKISEFARYWEIAMNKDGEPKIYQLPILRFQFDSPYLPQT